MSISHLIHANIHRAKEGARVLEDLARFVLRDEVLFTSFRKLRHSMKAIPPTETAQSDLGGSIFKENNVRANLLHLVEANALRIQEALRVLEELSPNLAEKQGMKAIRYEAYQLHLVIYKRMQKYIKQERLKGLYLIIDTDLIPLPLKDIVEIINQAPIQLVQLRSKSLSKRAFLEQSLKMKALLNQDILLIINDHIDIALQVADGIHLGQDDYPLEQVRKILPEHFIIGASCHSVEEAKNAEQAGASYIAVGCLFPTTSKADVVPTSLNTLGAIRETITIPLCAIGGITEANLPSVLPYSVEMIAMISTIWKNAEPLSQIKKIALSCQRALTGVST